MNDPDYWLDAFRGEDQVGTVWLREGALFQVCAEIEAKLVSQDPALFQRAGAIYLSAPGGLIKVDADLLRLRATRVIRFMKFNRQGNIVYVDPPLKYFAALLRKRDWKFPFLESASSEENR